MPSRTQIPKGKKQLNILISEELYNTLLQVASPWYGKNRGAISALIEAALRYYLISHAHTKSTQNNPKRGVKNVYNQVVEKIKEILHYDFKPDEIPEKILDLAIAEVRGSDHRTINKWKNLFHKSGLIKFLGGTYPNRVIELL